MASRARMFGVDLAAGHDAGGHVDLAGDRRPLADDQHVVAADLALEPPSIRTRPSKKSLPSKWVPRPEQGVDLGGPVALPRARPGSARREVALIVRRLPASGSTPIHGPGLAQPSSGSQRARASAHRRPAQLARQFATGRRVSRVTGPLEPPESRVIWWVGSLAEAGTVPAFSSPGAEDGGRENGREQDVADDDAGGARPGGEPLRGPRAHAGRRTARLPQDDEEKTRSPFYFTRFNWNTSASTQIFGVGQDYQGPDGEEAEMNFTLNLRYYSLNHPRRSRPTSTSTPAWASSSPTASRRRPR